MTSAVSHTGGVIVRGEPTAPVPVREIGVVAAGAGFSAAVTVLLTERPLT